MARVQHNSTLWPTFEPSEAPGLCEVLFFLAILARFDELLVHALETARGKGRDDYPVRALWNTVALMSLLGHGRFSAMLGELHRNAALAHALGFSERGGRVTVPEKWVLSRFWAKLKKDKYRSLVQQVLDETVPALKKEIPDLGQRVAIDSSDIRTHARPPGKSKKKKEVEASPANESRNQADTKSVATRPSADPEASWSVKTKIEEVDGQKQLRTEATFGYKAHACVDQKHAAVLAVRTTTGAHADVREAPELLAHAAELLGEDVIKEAAMDKAYDDGELIEDCAQKEIAAVVPVREVPEELHKQSAADRELTLCPGDNIVYDRYSGEVACYDLSGQEPTRREMTYAGFEKDRSTHKFRCPAAAMGFACGHRERCGGGSHGKHGRQVRVPMSTDPRRFAPIYPRSKRWKRAYKGRSSVERLFSIFKVSYDLEEHALRGRGAIELRVLLASITLNVTTLRRAEVARTVQATATAA